MAGDGRVSLLLQKKIIRLSLLKYMWLLKIDKNQNIFKKWHIQCLRIMSTNNIILLKFVTQIQVILKKDIIYTYINIYVIYICKLGDSLWEYFPIFLYIL